MKQNNPRQSPVHFDGGLFISPEGTADYTAGSLLFLVVVEPFADQISDQRCDQFCYAHAPIGGIVLPQVLRP